MIKTVEILKGERGLFINQLYRNKRIFEFKKGLNIITGRNGSGKSVLLDMIYKKLKYDDNDIRGYMNKYINIEVSDYDRVIYLNSENFNLKKIYDTIDAYNQRIATDNIMLFDGDYKEIFKLLASNLSTGEKQRIILNDLLSRLYNEKNLIILLDEIETHLDIDYQQEYFDALLKIAEKNQVIVASHSIFAFYNWKNVNVIKLNPKYHNKIQKIINNL